MSGYQQCREHAHRPMYVGCWDCIGESLRAQLAAERERTQAKDRELVETEILRHQAATERDQLKTQLSDALKRAEGAIAGCKRESEAAEDYRWRLEHHTTALQSEIQTLRADLARVTEEIAQVRRGIEGTMMVLAQDHGIAFTDPLEGHLGRLIRLVRGVASQRDAAQSRIQALEGMVGMLRGALDFTTPTTKLFPEHKARIQQALTLTESQAAEVVRGMVEALKEIEWSNSDSSWHRDRARQALAALEAVRGTRP